MMVCLIALIIVLLLYNKYRDHYSWTIDIIITIVAIILVIYYGNKFVEIYPDFIAKIEELYGRVV